MSDCKECGRLIPKRSCYRFTFDPHTFYCLHCVERVAERQFIECLACKKKTASYTGRYCYDCYVVRYCNSLVSSHLLRATKAGLPATLTSREWEETLKYFNKICAYCKTRPYQVLEHFIPLSHGIGGTTKENCVPACQACNIRKRNIHPDKLSGMFPIQTIEHIKTYLQGRKLEGNSYVVPCRNLVVV